MDEYRVETVEPLHPVSHVDFIFRTVMVGMTRLEDQRPFRLKLKRDLGLKVGDVVKLSPSTVLASRIVF